jgi:hypothetical protein
MRDFENLGAFYLGTIAGPDAPADREPVLYDSRDMTTHAVIVGMTGSGKTGLGIDIIEEAAIDGIPTIAIDPKGDLGNLLLNFPKLEPADFLPWVDEGEARRKGLTVDALAAQVAESWAKGLAAWEEGPQRVAKLRDAADFAIYTPGSSAGLPLSILRSLAAPPATLRQDGDGWRERIAGTVSGLLALLGIDADPLQSREHVLLANLVEAAWSAGEDLDLPTLIGSVQKPPFERVGVMDVESFYPARERSALAMRINNLLASPRFSVWMEGEPLDVQRLLWTPQGKPRVAVISIAHLSDAERMFFVTLLLNEIVVWMRGQSGTSSLRAMLYMDEVFGFFPPVAAPPAKVPMLTLLKQARAFGLGCVLATQNPVDLDYKGLSNAGTWFLGRLQTERDKARVIEGLEGANAAAGKSFDRQAMEATLAGLGNRVFLLNNVHEDGPVLFETRWTLSYLRGPLTTVQIQSLMAPRKAAVAAPPSPPGPSPAADTASARPPVPAGIEEVFLSWRGTARPGEHLVYRPALLGTAKLHFVDSKSGTDTWEDRALLLPVDANDPAWDGAERLDPAPELEKAPDPNAGFDTLPAAASRPKSYAAWSKDLADALYRTATVELRSAPSLDLVARAGESEGDFKVRVAHAARESRDAAIDALRKKYAAKLESLAGQEQRAQDRIAREQSQAQAQTVQTAISVGASLLGAFFGRKTLSSRNIGRATTAVRGVGRTLKEREDVGTAEQALAAVRQKKTDLGAELQQEIQRITDDADPASVSIEMVSIKPRKSDVTVGGVALCWTPFWVAVGGASRPAR